MESDICMQTVLYNLLIRYIYTLYNPLLIYRLDTCLLTYNEESYATCGNVGSLLAWQSSPELALAEPGSLYRGSCCCLLMLCQRLQQLRKESKLYASHPGV